MTVTLYHNPRCSKSRTALQLLRDKGVEPEIVEYLTAPPSAADFKDILAKMGKGPRDVLRRKEAKEEGIDVDALSDDALIAAMVAHPRAIERPIAVTEDQAVLGRPPEEVLALV